MDIIEIQSKKNMEGRRRMAVSKGAILGVRGQTAKEIRIELKSPSKRQEYFDAAEKKAALLTKK